MQEKGRMAQHAEAAFKSGVHTKPLQVAAVQGEQPQPCHTR